YALPRGDRLDAEDGRPPAPGPGPAGGFEDSRRSRQPNRHHARHDDLRSGGRCGLAGEKRHPQVPGGVRAIPVGRKEESFTPNGRGPLALEVLLVKPLAAMRVFTFVLTSGLWGVAGCGGGGSDNPNAEQDLNQLGMMFHNYSDVHRGEGPAKADDFQEIVGDPKA